MAQCIFAEKNLTLIQAINKIPRKLNCIFQLDKLVVFPNCTLTFELSSVVRRSRRIMRLVSVLMLETHNDALCVSDELSSVERRSRRTTEDNSS